MCWAIYFNAWIFKFKAIASLIETFRFEDQDDKK